MSNKQPSKAKALHAKVGDAHAVGVLALRVLLVEDTSGWFAQGLDIDYAASGATEEDAKKAFEEGFSATVHEHIRMNGNIKRLLKRAPDEAWQEFYKLPKKLLYSCIELHTFDDEADDLPFEEIHFLKAASAADLATA